MEEKKPRWEVKYEHFVDKESSIKIERSLKQENIKLWKEQLGRMEEQASNPDGSIDMVKLAKKRTEIAETEASLANDYKDFEIYEKNKKQLKNIYDYKKELAGKVKNIEDKYIKQNSETQERRSKLEDKKNEIEKAKANIEKQEEQIDSMLKTINSMPDGEERATNTSKLQKVTSANMKAKQKLEKMQQEYTIEDNQFMTDVSKNRQAAHKDEELLDKYKRRITKCNIIGAGLMKGKDLKDIDLDEKQEKPTQSVETEEQTRTESAPENNTLVNEEQTRQAEAPTTENTPTEEPVVENTSTETPTTVTVEPVQDEPAQESTKDEDDLIKILREQDAKQVEDTRRAQETVKANTSTLSDHIKKFIEENEIEENETPFIDDNPSRDPEYEEKPQDSKLEKKILFAVKHPILTKIGNFFKKLFRRGNDALKSGIEPAPEKAMTREEWEEQFKNKDAEKEKVDQKEIDELLKKYMPEFRDKSEENKEKAETSHEETKVEAGIKLEGETKKEEFMKSLDARDAADNTTTEVKKMSENDLLKAIAEKGSEKVFTEMVEQNKAAANARNAAKDQAWADRKKAETKAPEQSEK